MRVAGCPRFAPVPWALTWDGSVRVHGKEYLTIYGFSLRFLRDGRVPHARAFLRKREIPLSRKSRQPRNHVHAEDRALNIIERLCPDWRKSLVTFLFFDRPSVRNAH